MHSLASSWCTAMRPSTVQRESLTSPSSNASAQSASSRGNASASSARLRASAARAGSRPPAAPASPPRAGCRQSSPDRRATARPRSGSAGRQARPTRPAMAATEAAAASLRPPAPRRSPAGERSSLFATRSIDCGFVAPNSRVFSRTGSLTSAAANSPSPLVGIACSVLLLIVAVSTRPPLRVPTAARTQRSSDQRLHRRLDPQPGRHQVRGRRPQMPNSDAGGDAAGAAGRRRRSCRDRACSSSRSRCRMRHAARGRRR